MDSEKELYPCTICTRKFNRDDNLKRHVDSVHLKKSTLFCEYCGTACSTNDVLKRHLKNACKESPKNDSTGPIQEPHDTNSNLGN